MPRSIQFRMLMCNISAVGVLSMILAAHGYGQQTQSPNFGSQQPASKGNWFTNRLPWKGGVHKPGNSSRRSPIQHRDVSAQEKRVGQFSLARLAEKREQSEAAAKMYQSLIKHNPKDAAPYHRLGVMAAKSGDYKNSAQWLLKARELAPRDPEILRDLGYLYYKNGRLDDAENIYKQGLQLDPKNQGLANNYAMLLAEKQQYEQSLAMFEKVNKPAEAHANMGFMLVQMGNLEKAESYFNHALTLDKNLKSAAHGLMQTAQLTSQVDSMKKRSDAVAAAAAAKPPATASLSDNTSAAPASRIAAAPSVDSQIKQVARIESKPAPRAVQINPIRSGMAHSLEAREFKQPIVPAKEISTAHRRAVGTKQTASPSPGPARQRNTLRIGPSTNSSLRGTSAPTSDTKAVPAVKSIAPGDTSANSKLPNAQFHWSTSRFPTSQPTWTPDPKKTEVPE